MCKRRVTPPCHGLFVTGTDTGVGKTLVGCLIAREMRRRGLDVGVMKPVETGVGPDGPLDALALREAADAKDPLERICPQQFALPAAPNVAAAAAGRRVDLAAIESAYRELAAAHGWMLVEGAGGLLVPLCERVRMVDLAVRLGLSALVVARAALGTINHTLLTLEAAARRGLEVVGVVVSHAGGPLSAADAANLDALRSDLGERLIGEIPPLAQGGRPDSDAIDLERLLAAIAQRA